LADEPDTDGFCAVKRALKAECPDVGAIAVASGDGRTEDSDIGCIVADTVYHRTKSGAIGMWHNFIQTVLVLVTGLFPIINPPASALIVLSLVPRASLAERADLARRITLNSFAILLGSLAIGAYVLSFFGISIPVLRVAGGLIIGMAGWNLLQKSDDNDNDDEAQAAQTQKHAASITAKAFYPLTLPLTVGPGSIAVAIALGTSSPREGLSPGHIAGVGAALVILCASIYLCMRYAGALEKLLGTVGTQVAMKLFAFVIFCIGVQLCWSGLSELLATVPWK
jgi:multiple antibiotic resistance protein